MNIINIVNDSTADIEIDDLWNFIITAESSLNLASYFSEVEIAKSDDLISKISNSQLTVNNGTSDLDPSDAIRYISLHKHLNPQAPDGREIIRADSRPSNTETYFTSAGDTATGIGDGPPIMWDFSDATNTIWYEYDETSNGPKYPGYDVIQIDQTYADEVYVKEGAIYFFDAPWKSFIAMLIVCPAGGYYPNPYGSIPAAALGIPNDVRTFSYATTDAYITHYTNRHYMCGNCSMGDELNSEGCAMNPLPVGWIIRVLVGAPTGETLFKGYAELEMYRGRTVILPGDSI